MRSSATVAVVAVIGLAVASGLAGWLGRAHRTGFSWDVAAATATAYGTLALALVTWRLVASTRADAAGTLRLARLAEQDQDARLRPCVYPFANRHLRPTRVAMGDVGHLVVLPLQNGGQGLALNVTGHIYWPASNAALASTTLHPGDSVQLPIRGEVPIDALEIWGRLEYCDVLGRSWETRFVIEVGPDEKLRPSVRAYGFPEGLPKKGYPAGWELDRGSPWLALDDPRQSGGLGISTGSGVQRP